MRVPAPHTFERDYFETGYRDFDRQNPPRKLHHYRAAVERYAPPTRPLRVLDFGCAFGAFLATADPHWECYGTDVSAYALGHARVRAPQARLARTSGSDLPFTMAFDAITAWDVLEHIPEVERTLAELAAHLGPGGVLLFALPVYDGPLGALIRRLDADPTHIHRRSRAFWLDLAARHFHVADWWGLFRLLLPGGYYLHWPTRRLRRIAPAIAVVARRR